MNAKFNNATKFAFPNWSFTLSQVTQHSKQLIHFTQRPQGLMVNKLANMIQSVPDLYTPGMLGCPLRFGPLHVDRKRPRRS